MAHIYLILGIDPQTAMPGTYRTQSELFDSDGIWTYIEYTIDLFSAEEVTITYKVYIDWILSNPRSTIGKEKMSKLKSSVGFSPMKTMVETVRLEEPRQTHVSGKDLYGFGYYYGINPMGIDSVYANSYSENDRLEKIIMKWAKENKDRISTLFSGAGLLIDSTSIGQGVAAPDIHAQGLLKEAKVASLLPEYSAKASALQFENMALKRELEGLKLNMKILNEIGPGRQKENVGRLNLQFENASQKAANNAVKNIDDVISLDVRSIKSSPKSLKTATDVQSEIKKTLKISEQTASKEAATLYSNRTRIATPQDLAPVNTIENYKRQSYMLSAEAEALHGEMSRLGKAGKWLERAGYVGLALQGGCVILNGLLYATAQDEEEERKAKEAFRDSAEGFGISLGQFVGLKIVERAVSPQAALYLGISFAVLDVGLSYEKRPFSEVAYQHIGDSTLEEKQLHIDVKLGYHVGSDTKGAWW